MDDRELIEKAAKAAGLEGYRYCNSWRCMAKWNESDGGWFERGNAWSPLTDDGDALRLAVKLGMLVDTARLKANDSYCNIGDPYAATRRAIVRAAAAMADKEGG